MMMITIDNIELEDLLFSSSFLSAFLLDTDFFFFRFRTFSNENLVCAGRITPLLYFCLELCAIVSNLLLLFWHVRDDHFGKQLEKKAAELGSLEGYRWCFYFFIFWVSSKMSTVRDLDADTTFSVIHVCSAGQFASLALSTTYCEDMFLTHSLLYTILESIYIVIFGHLGQTNTLFLCLCSLP